MQSAPTLRILRQRRRTTSDGRLRIGEYEATVWLTQVPRTHTRRETTILRDDQTSDLTMARFALLNGTTGAAIMVVCLIRGPENRRTCACFPQTRRTVGNQPTFVARFGSVGVCAIVVVICGHLASVCPGHTVLESQAFLPSCGAESSDIQSSAVMVVNQEGWLSVVLLAADDIRPAFSKFQPMSMRPHRQFVWRLSMQIRRQIPQMTRR